MTAEQIEKGTADMYIPKPFLMDDPDAIRAHIEAHPFAALVVQRESGLEAVHLPLLLDADKDAHGGELGRLRGHIARANPVFDAGLEGSEVLVIFSGPQAYVSPGWYPSKLENPKVVPTWNYTAVHASGTLHFHDDKDWLLRNVGDLTDRFEAGQAEPWSIDDAPEDYIDAMTRAIVGMEIKITRLEGKAKLSQNRSEADRVRVAEGLRQSGAAELARLMRA